MSIPRFGFVVTFDGSPYAFASDGVVSVSTSDTNWPRGVTVLNGWYAGPNEPDSSTSRLTETLDLANGDCNVDGFTFKLHDKKVTISGTPREISTYLFTRDEESIASTRLASTFSASASSFTVLTPNDISSYIPGVLWVEQEAINCSAIDTMTGVVTVAASGRGYYGTLAKAHTVNAELGQYQEVFAAMPWLNRRRVILWETTSLGSSVDVRSVWFGYANRPRLGSDGATFEVQAEHVGKIDGDRSLGQVDAVTQLRGFNTRGIRLSTNNFGSGAPFYNTVTDNIKNTLISAVQTCVTSLNDAVSGIFTPPTTNIIFSAGFDTSGVVVNGDSLGYNMLWVSVTIQGQDSTRQAIDPSLGALHVTVPLPRTPAAIVALPIFGGPVPITRTDGVPNSNAITGGDYDWEVATFEPILRGDYDDNRYVILRPASATPVTADDSTINGGPSYNAFCELAFKEPTQPAASVETPGWVEDVGTNLMVYQPIPLFSIIKCDAYHWLTAIKYALDPDVGGSLLNHGIDDRHWDFVTNYQKVVNVTSNLISSRIYRFDGEKKLNDILLNECKAAGCCKAVTADGKMTVIYVQGPTPNTATTSLNYQTDFEHKEKPTWYRWEDFPINRAKITSPQVASFVVVNQRSVDRYGQGRTIEIELESLTRPEVILDNPTQVAVNVFQRTLNLYDRPIDCIRFAVKFDKRLLVALGKWVSITDWLAPNGQGTRGNTSRTGMVIRREVDYKRGIVWVTALCPRRVYGYAPSAKVSSISGAVLTIAVDYIKGISDYAASDKTWYTGTPNDGGTTKFVAGDKVRLVLMDTTTKTTESFTIQSVSQPTITLTASVPTVPTDWPTLAGSGLVHLEYDEYATCTTTQQSKYAFWGNDTTGVIDGTSTDLMEWST